MNKTIVTTDFAETDYLSQLFPDFNDKKYLIGVSYAAAFLVM